MSRRLGAILGNEFRGRKGSETNQFSLLFSHRHGRDARVTVENPMTRMAIIPLTWNWGAAYKPQDAKGARMRRTI